MPEPATAELYRVELPMAVGFDHPARKRSVSDSLVLSLEVAGLSGIGECAPRQYVTGETSAHVAHALRALPLEVIAASVRDTDPALLLARLLREGAAALYSLPGGNNLHCLVETALLDLLGKHLSLPARDLVPAPDGPDGTAAVTSSALPVSQVLDLSLDVEEFLDTRGPFHFVKTKASHDIARDVRTVTAIRARLGDRVPVLVDANMSWTPEQAVGHTRALREAGATFVEEPLAKGAWEQLARLRAEGGLPIMLDESVCTLDDARAALAHGACDAFNIRVAKNGGPVAAARLAGFAREHGFGFQIGVQVAEVGPLITAGRTLAFRNPDALTVEGGQSDRFFPDMIVSPQPAVDRDTNTVADVVGHGFGLELNHRAAPWAEARRTEGDPAWHPVAPAATRTPHSEDHT
ncbi:enolase C-terminal domain-like protein [Streptomyces sp. NPDC052042]|uniref:enolase C-terminal domain-like protein n=1 Tax=Streptomyces sp. NPDC052042 TaxID=3365683 RepID=UPI0037D3DF18